MKKNMNITRIQEYIKIILIKDNKYQKLYNTLNII